MADILYSLFEGPVRCRVRARIALALFAHIMKRLLLIDHAGRRRHLAAARAVVLAPITTSITHHACDGLATP